MDIRVRPQFGAVLPLPGVKRDELGKFTSKNLTETDRAVIDRSLLKELDMAVAERTMSVYAGLADVLEPIRKGQAEGNPVPDGWQFLEKLPKKLLYVVHRGVTWAVTGNEAEELASTLGNMFKPKTPFLSGNTSIVPMDDHPDIKILRRVYDFDQPAGSVADERLKDARDFMDVYLSFHSESRKES